ncbi:MAG TPA: HupE/UreJ family protein [Arenibaculum sp.]|nr:HupE/UreJ family protein [Arenibaculum sp.]
MRRAVLPAALVLAAVSGLPAAALAHTGAVTGGAGFIAGFAHPLFGLDHLLAMFAVGLWAAQLGGRALWAVPASFVGAMVLAGAAAMAGAALPAVELGILGSVVVLGLLVALQPRLPLAAATLVVAAFAAFHGHAHGSEMPIAADPVLYGIGFALATAFLHGVGVAAVLGLRRTLAGERGSLAARGAGFVIGGTGLVLAAFG